VRKGGRQVSHPNQGIGPISNNAAFNPTFQDLAAQAQTTQGSAAELINQAGTGFHLEPWAAAVLIKCMDDCLIEVETSIRQAYALQEAPQLGTLAGAVTISKFTQAVATDEQGILPAVLALRATFVQMRQAYQKASTNYQETDQMLADIMKQQTAGMPGSAPGGTPQASKSTFQA
jgi:hypothetical protein